MFLKASQQPPLGTHIRIDLELPSATVIEIQGSVAKHVTDPQRGTGVELTLDPLPTKTVWLIESALAAETKVRAQTEQGGPNRPPTEPPEAVPRGDVAEAETDLVRALEAEAESLKKLNPFLVLGVGYETNDGDVRAAFGELTKRYHPDRFARYQSTQLRQTAAEIFILIRDAYRKLADEPNRQQVLATLKPSAPKRPSTPAMPQNQFPRAKTPPPAPRPAGPAAIPPKLPPAPTGRDSAHDIPTNPSARSQELASTELAKGEDLAVNSAPTRRQTPAGGVPKIDVPARKPTPLGGVPRMDDPAPSPRRATPAGGVARIDDLPPSPRRATPVGGVPRMALDEKSGPVRAPAAPTTPMAPGPVKVDSDYASDADMLIDQGRLDDALAAFRAASKKAPGDRALRAGVELVEGLKALEKRDRMEAAQRFEAALEHDPSNERAARELAEMRRLATNERKGLLSRLMGKKEPGFP